MTERIHAPVPAAPTVVAPAVAEPQPHRSATDVAIIVLAVVAVVAAARIAEVFLVPVVLGILLSYTLRPLVAWLAKMHIVPIAGAALAIAAVTALLASGTWALREDFTAAIAELPGAARKLRQVADATSRDANSSITHMKAAAAELDRAAASTVGKPAAASPALAPSGGVAAQLQTFIATQSAQLLTVVGQILTALLLAYFLLVAGDSFRRKVAHLAGASLTRRRITVEVLNEIDLQIQRYMLTLLVANTLIGLAVWGGLALLGTSNAGLWGVIVGILHVIPYAGTIIAAAVVGVATLVDVGTVQAALLAVLLILAVAVVIGIGFTTWLQGRASRMNAVATFVGVLFFGWLWGGWGLLLGMPLLAVLKSIADRVEAMHPVRELLRA